MLDIMVLYTIYEYELSMYLILKKIYEIFGDFSKPSFGALKPALTKLEKNGFVKTRKTFSQGGKLTVFYGITNDGKKALKQYLVENISDNPVQFLSNCAIKIIASDILSGDSQKLMLSELSKQIEIHKIDAEKNLQKNPNLTPLQKIMLDNLVVEYGNFLRILSNI